MSYFNIIVFLLRQNRIFVGVCRKEENFLLSHTQEKKKEKKNLSMHKHTTRDNRDNHVTVSHVVSPYRDDKNTEDSYSLQYTVSFVCLFAQHCCYIFARRLYFGYPTTLCTSDELKTKEKRGTKKKNENSNNLAN